METNEKNNYRIANTNVDIVRFITSLLSYIFLLMGSSIVIYFAFKRGNPIALEVFYCLALALNLTLMVLTIVNFVLKRNGIYNKTISIVEASLLITWGIIIFIEFIAACIIFDMFRLDSFLISIVQAFVIFLMLYLNKKVDYYVNHHNKQESVGYTRNPEVIKKKDSKKNALYIIVCVSILVIESLALVLPMMPPRVDDMFSENRLLHYTYIDNINDRDDGYYVTDTYLGTNSKIIIPLTYNNKPVVGISKNAINDKGKITEVQIGEYDSEGKLKSNIKYIDENAIKLNDIAKLDLPESVAFIDKNGISGDKIETINYHSKNGFRRSSLNLPNLKTINLLNEEATVNLDYNNFNEKINVPLDLYNDYRKEFFDNRDVFTIQDQKQNVVIDFETNCDIYLESKILDKDSAKLNLTSLKNNGDETSSLIADTDKYNKDHYDCEGFISKPGYVFRGWYRDANFTQGMECVFTNNDYVTFTENTTLYAKWEEIKVLELDWNQYYPYNESITKINFVSSKDLKQSIKLPAFNTAGGDIKRLGYKDLQWIYKDKKIEKTADLYGFDENYIKIKATWILEKPTMSYQTVVGMDVYEGSNLTFKFDEKQKINYIVDFEHVSDEIKVQCNLLKETKPNEFTKVTTVTTTNKDRFNYLLRNAADSGHYRFECIAISNTGEVAQENMNYDITITKKDLDISGLDEVVPIEITYDGNKQIMLYNHPLPSYISASVNYDLGKGYNTIAPKDARNEAYPVKFIFANIGEEKDNYNKSYKYSNIKINPAPVTANWVQSDPKWSKENTVVYSGKTEQLIPVPKGLFGKDNVSFIMREKGNIDCGNDYQSTIIGLTSSNYYIDDDNTIKNKTYSIIPKPVSVSWKNKNQVYNGKNINFELNLFGIVDRDRDKININNFKYTTKCDVSYNNKDSKLIFTSKDVDKYAIDIKSFDNKNYVFNSINDQLEIKPAPLNLTWKNFETTYNGKEQFLLLNISGFLVNDGIIFDNTVVKEKFNIVSSCDYNVSNKTANSIELKFGATNANTYNIKVQEIKNSNYYITPSTKDYIIKPRVLLGNWTNPNFVYNGYNQNIQYKIEGLNPVDSNKFVLGDFGITSNCINSNIVKQVGDKGGVVLLNFYGKDAGEYNITINSFNSSNYNGNYVISAPATKTFNISKKEVDLTWDNKTFIYDGNPHAVTARITNLCEGDIVDLKYNDNNYVNANSYNASVIINHKNYKAPSVNSYEWDITPKILTPTFTDNTSVYNGQYQYYQIEFKGFYGDDIKEFNDGLFHFTSNHESKVKYDSYSVIDNTFVYKFKIIDADDYVINLNSEDIGNYDFDVNTFSFKIDKKAATFNWSYVGETPKIYQKGTSHQVKATLKNPCQREDTTLYDTTDISMTGNEAIDAGNYLAKVSYLSNSNYKVDEHQLGANITYSWEIKPLPVEVEWKSNNDLIFNAMSQYPTPSATNIADTDTKLIYDFYDSEGLRIDSESMINVGTYKLKAVGISGGHNRNYVLPKAIIELSYKIVPRELSVAFKDLNAIYNGHDNSVIRVTFSNFPTMAEAQEFTNGKKFNATGSIANNCKGLSHDNVADFDFYTKNANSYSINISNVSLDKNYKFKGINAIGHIQPLKIALRWPKETYTYDGTSVDFRPQIINKCGNDVVNLQYAYSGSSNQNVDLTTTNAKDAGTYTIKVTGVSNNNYITNSPSESAPSQTFTINKRDIIINLNSDSNFIYNGGLQGVSLAISGFILEDQAIFNTNPFNYTVTSNTEVKYGLNKQQNSAYITVKATNANSYAYDINNLKDDLKYSNYNYIDVNKTKSFTINKAPVIYEWKNKTKVYNGQAQTITANIISDIYGNDQIISTYAQNSYTDVGEYSSSITKISNSNYYIASGSSVRWNIVPKTLTGNISVSNKTYDGKYSIFTLSISGIASRDKDNVGLNTLKIRSGSLSPYFYKDFNDHVEYKFRAIDAGLYNIGVIDFAHRNYNINSIDEGFYIYKKDLQLEWGTKRTFTYDGCPHEMVCKPVNIVTREDGLTDSINLPIINNIKTDAGHYSASISNSTNIKNYNIGGQSYDWYINKKPVTGSWEAKTKPFVYTGNKQLITLVIDGVVSQDSNKFDTSSLVYNVNTDITSTKCYYSEGSLKYDFLFVNAGDYLIGVEKFSNYINNYSLSVPDYRFTVNKKPVSFAYSSQDIAPTTYNGSYSAFDIKLSGVVPRDAINLVPYVSVSGATSSINTNDGITITAKNKDAGNHVIKATLQQNQNYNASPIVINRKINNRAINVVDSQQNVNEKIYDAKETTNVITLSNIVASDVHQIANVINNYNTNFDKVDIKVQSSNIIISLSAKNAGQYFFKVNANVTNYESISINKNMTINKKDVTVNVDSIKTGSLLFNGDLSEDRISTSQYRLKLYLDSNHEKVVNNAHNKGTYYYEITLLNSNYNLINKNGTFVVK